MPRPGRNEPCPCGSGRKLKRCCGERRGPDEQDLARAFLAHQAHAAARQLRHLPERQLRSLFDDVFDLPKVDLALAITLPPLLTPELQHLYDAVRDDDYDAGEQVIPTILARLDTQLERARLARELIRLRDAQRIEPLLTAAAIIDLDSDSPAFLRACLIHTAYINTGIDQTPGGLQIAA